MFCTYFKPIKRYAIIVSLLLWVTGCKKDVDRETTAPGEKIQLQVKRFEVAFSKTTGETLEKTKSDFPYLFPENFPDSIWIYRLRDTLQRSLLEETIKVFPDFEKEQKELENLFQYIRYYFPDTSIPQVVTLTSDVDYRNKVIYTDTLLLISLDTYLGENHRFYKGIQQYIRKNFTRNQIIPDVAVAFGEQKVGRVQGRSFIEKMVYYGKLLYLKDQLIPSVSDARKIGYSEQELIWARENEQEIWRYFVERELLFSTDSGLTARFISPAPFSKFYLELDAESPGRVGRYIGWQIVRSYMRNNAVSLQHLLNLSGEEIFATSGYKPQR